MDLQRRRLVFEFLETRTLLTAITLVRHFDNWNGGIIPSTDVAGVTFHPPSGHLFLADSEINEIPQFVGDNMFEVSLLGDALFGEYASNNTEPTGITYNQFDGYFYVTNDTGDRLITRYDANLNNPLLEVSTEDAVPSASDPEGITSDPSTGFLYVADGSRGGRQVLVYNSDLQFQYSFSVADRMADAEGIAYHAPTNHLFIVDGKSDKVLQYTLGGSFVAEFDISGFSPAPDSAQGATFAPSSDPNDAPDVLSLYIADGMQDNFPDGRVYEVNVEITPPGTPTTSGIPDVIVGEDAPNTVIDLFAAFEDDEDTDAELTYTIEGNTNPSLFAATTVNGTLGTLTLDYAPATTGIAVLTIRAADTSTPPLFVETSFSVTVGQPDDMLYFSLTNGADLPGIAVPVEDEDIVAYDGTDFSLLFDGSDVGLSGLDVNAFSILSDGTILMSMTAAATIGSLGNVDDSDIVRFVPSSLGESTAGTFELYFDGSDVELTKSAEDIVGLDVLSDGTLLISTKDNFSVSGATGFAEDLLAFSPTQLGQTTAGTWSLHFDGSDVELADVSGGEAVDAVAVGADGRYFLSTVDVFTVSGVSGNDEDVLAFTPTSMGGNTSGSFEMFLDGSSVSLGGEDVNALDVPNGPPNQPPDAVDDGYNTAEDNPLVVNAAGVLANDSDGDGDPLTASLVSGTSSGTMLLNSDGSFTYTPAANFNGADSFTYRANDGTSSSSTATVTITVTPVNDPPVAESQSVPTNKDTAVAILLGGSDVDGDPLAYNITSGPSNGSLSGAAPNLTYTPNSGYIGTDSFTFKTNDGALDSNLATVSITVSEVESGPQLRHGVVPDVGEAWITVNLDHTYTSMVVIAAANYDTANGPGVVRIRNASGSRFDVRVDRAGPIAISGVAVHYVVVEEGVYAEPDYKLEAVKYTSTVTDENNSWTGQTRSYQQAYTAPVVVGQVMSYNDSDWSVFWASGGSRSAPPSSSALTVGKHVGEDSDVTRANETIGYLVIESNTSGSAQIEGLPYVAAVGADTVKGVGDAPGYDYTYNAMPNSKAAVVSQAGMDGGNGGWAILYGANPLPPSTGRITLAVDEDQHKDTERRHTTEQVAYLIIDPPEPARPLSHSPPPTGALHPKPVWAYLHHERSEPEPTRAVLPTGFSSAATRSTFDRDHVLPVTVEARPAADRSLEMVARRQQQREQASLQRVFADLEQDRSMLENDQSTSLIDAAVQQLLAAKLG